MSQAAQFHARFSALDPDPVEAINVTGPSPILLTCEHAGRRVPQHLGDLGIDATEMERHIAYDIGAEALSRKLSERLDAPLFLQRYSRLVIDCNRPFHVADCFPAMSDGTAIPVNQSLSEQERRLRYQQIHVPFHQAVGEEIAARRHAGKSVILVSVHSFTRVMASTGDVRYCDLGLLYNRDRRLSDALMDDLASHAPDIGVAFNTPYLVDDESDYTIPVHGEGGNIPHVLLEIRNDHIADEAGQRRWTEILAEPLESAAAKIAGVSGDKMK